MVKRYLELRSLDEALTLLTSSFTNPRRTEKVPLMQSVGRVVAEPVFAKYSVPEVNISAMDGIAVRSRDTIGATDRSPGNPGAFRPGQYRQYRTAGIRCGRHDRGYLGSRG